MAIRECPKVVTRAILLRFYFVITKLRKVAVMKRFIASAIILGVCSVGLFGCAEKETAKKEATISTPGGTTTIKTETDVKKTGKNPPDAP
jgi:hypothetical protein